MTENEKMLAGMIYDPNDDELIAKRRLAHRLSAEYNTLTEDDERRGEILRTLMPDSDKNIYLQGPIQFDYGCNTVMGENTYANFNLVVLDVCPVTIGKNVYMGPNVSILTALHPMRWQERLPYQRDDGVWTDYEYGKPIVIGDNCWFGGNVTVCGGVTIGEGSVIGAGSVVVKDIPAGVLAAGNPCRVIRPITDQDSIV
ncbi:maltose O-acetyltransferase [Ruminococcaceae bacterium YRB3002]|nr:maltose O-acetyltransferase [Ruminococcaceae bacterium YRB3002]